MKTTKLDKLLELCLYLFLILLPFSYSVVDVRHGSINIIIALLLCTIFFTKRYNILDLGSWKVFFAIFFLYVFNFSEKVNFIQQFGLPVEITKRIPFSTILLSILFLIFLVKYLINKNINLPNQPFIKYLFCAFIFLFVLALIFYPFLYIHYQMGLRSDLLLLNKLVKYLLILLVVTNYIDSETKVKRLSIPLMISLGLSTIISLIMIIINIK